jgi:hypothetical protein
MSNLWVQAMSWHQEKDDPIQHKTIRVNHAGFGGYVGDSEHDRDYEEQIGSHDEGPEDYDEDLRDETYPEPTHEEEQHFEEHGEYPDSHYERHDQAYEKALQARKDEDKPDIEDPGLGHFIREHHNDHALWQNKGSLGMVALKKPVYATQAHVSQHHVQRYLDNPQGQTAHQMKYGPQYEQLADQAPMFVTHEGRLHAIEGHHRIAAALQRGDEKIHGWHFDLDKHPQYKELYEGEDEE